ncbi:MAG: Lrp/AsnC ligand binding domain-containing protein [Nitrososphaerales archaeon]|nr:Lrp/AsnC ligand binding domain-containing protein [Nitrososphaerales archaeon]
MLNGVILIKTWTIRTDDVLKAVQKIPEVKRAFITYGRFDICAFIEVPNYDVAKDVVNRVNALEAVRSTETLIEA